MAIHTPSWNKLVNSLWKLLTAAGNSATVYGEVDMILRIGTTTISHRFDSRHRKKCNHIPMDITNIHDFRLNLKQRTLRIRSGELILHNQPLGPNGFDRKHHLARKK